MTTDGRGLIDPIAAHEKSSKEAREHYARLAAQTTEKCAECKGVGWVSPIPETIDTCPVCKGEGTVTIPQTTSSKTARFVAEAVENEITFLRHVAKLFPDYDDIQADLANDIRVYQSVLPILKSGRWPENV